MNAERFDDFTRTLVTGASRRQILRTWVLPSLAKRLTETDFSPPQASGIHLQTLGAFAGFSRLLRETIVVDLTAKRWYNAVMKKLTIRIPDDMHEQLVAYAKAQHRSRVSKNAVFGLNFLPGFWTWQILWIVPILTGFGPHPRGPKSGQEQLADLDALT